MEDTNKEAERLPDIASEAVLVTSQEFDPNAEKVQGYDFDQGIDHHKLLKSFNIQILWLSSHKFWLGS